jgi:hypothetical protein
MSYATAPTFEANKIGVRRVYTLGDFRGMGDVNDTAQGMIGEGYDPNVIYPLVSFGATDVQLQNLWNNYGAGTPEFNAAENGLLAYLKSQPNIQAPPVNMQTSPAGAIYGAATGSSGGATAGSLVPGAPAGSPAPPTPSPAAAPGPGAVPSGSVFTYTVQWSTSLLNVSGPSQILAAVNSILQQHNINIVNSSIPSTYLGQATGFSIVIQTTIAFGQVIDVKSICDGAVAQAGRQVTSSTLTPGGSMMPGSLPAAGASATGALTSWFMQNWGYLAAALIAIAVAPQLAKKL